MAIKLLIGVLAVTLFVVLWTIWVAPRSILLLKYLPPPERTLPNPIVLFSEVNGQLLKHGKPVQGATIERTWSWNAEPESPIHKETTVTNAQGHFHFDEVHGDPAIEKAHGRMVPVVEQHLNWLKDGEVVDIYFNSRNDYAPKSETGESSIYLVCDKSSIEQVYGDFHRSLSCELRRRK